MKKIKPEDVKFKKGELDFINKIAESAFQKNSRPLVLFGICGAILSNIIRQSGGVMNKKNITKFVRMTLE